MTALPVDLDIEGAAAPPRANGELVFAEPWESRIFGMTLALHDAGYFDWPAFQAELIAAVARWEADHDPAAPYQYYACWLQAFEVLLDRLDLLDDDDLRARIAEHLDRPVGHDHDHDHRGA